MSTDAEYAYEVAYERGWYGRPLKPWPEQCPRTGPMARGLRKGFKDGTRDREEGLAYRASFDPRE